ncbi:coiled-coil domain-containing protein 57 isoform X4 [Hydra vulgaris]|uniref:Coiled-coil domain-containing protein 57 isoform X4 n=1 Tax=Hydra vulgaris TaxID=6087 RepID=A0ABM4D3U5_HYDVU
MALFVPPQDLESLDTLVTVKEQEWRSLMQQQISKLKSELAEKDKQISLQKIRFNKLKEDFEYNLDLLSKRDIELEKCDVILEKLKESENLKDAELNETRFKMEFLEEKMCFIIKENENSQDFYKKKIKSLQDEINVLNEKNEIEISKERLRCEEVKNVFHKQISELQEGFEMQKKSLIYENETKFCQHKKDHQIILDEKETELFENQLKVKMLSIELELLQKSSSLATDNAAADQEKLVKFEKLLAQKIKEIESVNLIKDIQLKDLETKVEEFIQRSKKKRIEIKKKCNELQNCCARQDAFVETLKNSANNQEEIFKEKLKTYNEQNKALSFQLKQNHLKYITSEKTLETKLHSAQQEIEHLKFRLQHLQDIQSQTTVTRDVDFAALSLSENNLKHELDNCRIDLKKLRQELKFSLEREKTLKENKEILKENSISERKSKALLENRLNKILENHKSVIENFEKRQEKLDIVIQKKEEELLLKENTIQKLKIDLSSVKAQNNQLKMVIKEMRAEMVLLSEKMNAAPNETYLQSLEAEIALLKSTNRDLKNKLQDHVTTLDVFQNENSKLLTLLKTKDSTITYLKNSINSFENERKQKIISMETVYFDSSLGNFNHEVAAKKKKINEQTKPESEKCYTHGLACNFNATCFNSGLSDFQTVFGKAAEYQQLDYSKVCPDQHCSSMEFCKYKWKLKLAVDRIKNLLIERAKMINNSNRLRADFKSLQENLEGYCSLENCGEINRQNQVVLQSLQDFQKQATLGTLVNLKVSSTLANSSKSNISESLENHKNRKKDGHGDGDEVFLNKEAQDELKETLNSVVNNLISSSSDSSLKEVWKLLDMGDSFSTVESKQEADLAVLGKPVLVEQKLLYKKNFIAPKLCVKKKFARNYNDKNDNNFSNT